MTDCMFRERLSDYHDGDLGAVEAEQVREHLATSHACGCREELAALHTLVRDLGELAPGPVRPGGWERLSARLDRRRASRWEWMLPLAALLLLTFAAFLFRSANRTTPGPREGKTVTTSPAPRPAESEVPGLPFDGLASGRPTVVAAERTGSSARAVRPPRPRFQANAVKASLSPTRVPADLIVAYGAEVEPIDRLLRALRRISQQETGGRRVPQAEPYDRRREDPQRTSDDGVREQIAALEALRADVLAELVMQAQARAAAPWR